MKIHNFKTAVNPFSVNSLVNHYFNKSDTSQLVDNKLGIKVRCVGIYIKKLELEYDCLY